MNPLASLRNRRRKGDGGFTILEMIIVVALIGILAAIAIPQLRDRPQRAKEVVLKTNLRSIRDALDQHYGDRGNYPSSLEALVDVGYLRVVPLDPITGSRDTWELVYEEFDSEFTPAETDLPEDGSAGVIDVYSGSDELSLDGTPYSEW